MAEFLLVVLVMLVLLVVGTAGTALYALHRLRCRNRVSPTVRGHAPLTWLCSPWPAARLHRRLRASVLATRSCAGGPTVAELAGELERHAVALDQRLVVAHRSPTPVRHRLLAEIVADVHQVELLNERVARLSASWSAPGSALPGTGVAAVRDRLDALDAATRELTASRVNV